MSNIPATLRFRDSTLSLRPSISLYALAISVRRDCSSVSLRLSSFSSSSILLSDSASLACNSPICWTWFSCLSSRWSYICYPPSIRWCLNSHIRLMEPHEEFKGTPNSTQYDIRSVSLWISTSLFQLVLAGKPSLRQTDNLFESVNSIFTNCLTTSTPYQRSLNHPYHHSDTCRHPTQRKPYHLPAAASLYPKSCKCYQYCWYHLQ